LGSFTAPVSGYVALYAIYNPTTATAALLAQNASTLKPNVYGGANMPAGYTASALLAVWPTNGSGQFVVGYQRDRRLSILAATVLNSATNTSNVVTSLAVGGAIPSNAVRVFGFMSAQSSVVSQTALYLYASSASVGQQQVFSGLTTSGNITSNFTADISTAQTLYYATTSTGGTLVFVIAVSGYEI
jgi:hypothetical protein